ncbi:MAG TPA: 3'(2'),5'-bisphosphate nucleotidase CysQ [Puia sp.]|jgi:3'(2'), 5'-bisphosphate nucleotidase|nr:3'(2'),5'-bisphosphate nucleotidase CysQ [Puia sp.]
MGRVRIERMVEVAVEAAMSAGKEILKIYHQGSPEARMKADNSPVTIADRSSQAIIVDYLLETGLPVISEEDVLKGYHVRKSWEFCWLVDPLDGTKEFIAGSGEFTINIGLVHRGRPVAGVLYIPCNDGLYVGSTETGIYKRQAGQMRRLWAHGSGLGMSSAADRLRFEDLLEKSPLRVVGSRFHWSAATEEFIKQFPNVTSVTAGSSLKFMSLLEEEADLYPRLGRTMEWDTAAAHAILNAAGRGIYLQDLSGELVYNKEDLSNPYFIAF